MVTISYYEPWGDVVLFYGDCNPNDQLYELGKVVSGAEWIAEISGSITVSAEQGDIENQAIKWKIWKTLDVKLA